MSKPNSLKLFNSFLIDSNPTPDSDKNPSVSKKSLKPRLQPNRINDPDEDTTNPKK